MLEINGVEAFVLAFWVLGVAAGFWFFLSTKTIQSILVLGISMFIPVVGSVTALVFAACRHRALRHG